MRGQDWIHINRRNIYSDRVQIIHQLARFCSKRKANIFMEEVLPESREEKYYDYSDLKEIEEAAEEYLAAA